MGFYRKKPVTVEAIQWNDNNLEIQAFCKDAEFEARRTELPSSRIS